MEENPQYVIEMRNIVKEFPGIKANDNITLKLKKGEIHALLGENGAGKSTLMSVLFGLYQPDGGSIYKDGVEVHIKSPNDATALHIGMVHQHFKLVECFSVLDNIILGDEDSRFGWITKKKAKAKCEELMEKYGLEVDLDRKVSDISVGMQQRAEILKMLYRDNDILIFDEPTAVLTPQEIENLMVTMKNMAKEGKSILFISHKLNEIMDVSDTCTVLRKGKLVGTVKTKDTNSEKLAEMMVGHEVSFTVEKNEAKPGNAVLEVSDVSVKDPLTRKETVKDVSFKVFSGEILCIAGIEGNGQTQLINALTGIDRIQKGKMILNGNDVTRKNIYTRIKEGMSHIPEDRQKYGLVLDYNVEQNMVIEQYRDKRFSNHGWIRFGARKKYSDEMIGVYDVRTSQGSKTVTRSMSGGNQQKLIIGREMDKKHSLLVAVQPTRGLDVGAVSDIHSKIVADRDKGAAVLLISLELDEVMNLADRILVMYEGEIVGSFNPKTTTVSELGLYMAGAKRMAVDADGNSLGEGALFHKNNSIKKGETANEEIK
ncbi:MAG: ABC transporter ATP-binding protein [Bacilli bacterium]